MHSLPVLLRLSGRPVILVGEGDAAAAKRRLLERAGAVIVGEQEEASLAIVALDDEDEALAVVARLKARGILVNATDRPALCDFTLPAIVDRDPVLIAIGTGGASAGLAKALRQRIEALLPPSLGILAKVLHEARGRIRAKWPDAADRRKAIDAAFDPGGLLDPFARVAPDAVEQWLSGESADFVQGVQTILLNSDDPDDLTLGQARLLASADVVVHQGAPAAILARVRADAVMMEGEDVLAPLLQGLTVLLVGPA